MTDVDVPEHLISLKLAAGRAAVALSEHVRTHGPTQGWAAETMAEGIALQRECDRANLAFHQALEGTAFAYPGGDRTARMALAKAAAMRAEQERARGVPDEGIRHSE
ncbi:hypothetical protein [Yinghuangia seranimata]|uniref:hypothetical protein n=1 Tax=Yinghuangia seranimata TaxID=408067 RepID=UPI00248B87C7|nr:hypothetical protein [Yinghuangia seranimata]MDI2128140.1 hypothetical protein [Yinghuangia seranimata]